MNENVLILLKALVLIVPFVLLILLGGKANLKKQERHRQGLMPLFALIYCLVVGILIGKVNNLVVDLLSNCVVWLDQLAQWLLQQLEGQLADVSALLVKLSDWLEAAIGGVNFSLFAGILSNILIILAYIVLKTIISRIGAVYLKDGNALHDKLASLVYYKDEVRRAWFVKPQFAQGISLMRTLFIASVVLAVVGIELTAYLVYAKLMASLYYPVFSVILLGELFYFMDGVLLQSEDGSFQGEEDISDRISDYSLMRKILRRTFGDKLLCENTTVNNGLTNFKTNEELLDALENDDDPMVEAYGKYMRRELANGLDMDQNYLMSGLDLLKGKSILFNNPFYHDLAPYVFYPMNRAILRHKKVLIILGRHATDDSIKQWCCQGLASINHLPALWNVDVLSSEPQDLDVGIITRSSVHDLKLHEANEEFFSEVEFIVLIEPSKLVTTAQIGLNSIVKYCRRDGNSPVFCSTDKNCDGIVDALSHILMTSLEEVSATKRHDGTSSYMCWEVDNEHLQHRLLPNISRYLGVGTELSFAALKNQIPQTAWYGGDAFPVQDMHWIAKQYHYDLLTSASLPAQQSVLDEVMKVSHNLWDANVQDRQYLTVEDESFNMFEIKREFSTRARKQGFINVVSTDYLLKDYMAANDSIFNADAKAIPYIVADYANTERNIIYRLCLRLSTCMVTEQEILRELSVLGIEGEDVLQILWDCIRRVSRSVAQPNVRGDGTLQLTRGGRTYTFNSHVLRSKRVYSFRTARMENMIYLDNKVFVDVFLSDLCNAEYISEDEHGQDQYLGTELKGHIFQKYLPGQFFTFGGKYYEMQRLSADGKVVVRRAADHIDGRPQYRQERVYTIQAAVDSETIGDVRDMGVMQMVRQYADFTVDTPAYWDLQRYHDFANGRRVAINGVQQREYFNKAILKLTFENISKEKLDTLAMLMNEVFRTLYAENQNMIVAVTPGQAQVPLTYSLQAAEGCALEENSIYIIEDSQMDMGLLISVERNMNRIFRIVCDYLQWHFEAMEESEHPTTKPAEKPVLPVEKKGKKEKKPRKTIGEFFRDLFKRKPKEDKANESIKLFSVAANIEVEADESVTVGAEKKRQPYHARTYLFFGGDKVPENLDLQGTLDLLRQFGYGNSFLEQARKGKDEADKIERSFVPNRTGVKYCDFCGVELSGIEYEVLADGRERCVTCSRTAVRSEEEFRRIYETVVRNMRTFYGVNIHQPVQIKMVNAKKLHRHLGKSFVPTSAADGRVLGVAIKDKNGYTILLENGSPRISTTMTLVHELTHIWQYLNWDQKQIRSLYGKERELMIYEGMAKWAEIQYAYLINEAASAKREEIITRVREDAYGKGFCAYATAYPLTAATVLRGDTPFDHPNKPLDLEAPPAEN